MTKYLTAKEKSREVGISLSGLAKTRHLYKHIQKSPRKFLYFQEEDRLIKPVALVAPANSRSVSKRRDVHPGDTRYSNCPGGSGENFKLLNQMRAKASLEGKIAPKDLKYLDGAMAIKIKDNAQQIVEQEQNKKRSELLANEEMARKKDPSRYGGMIRNNRSRVIDVQTPWKDLNPKEPDEYDRYTKEHFRDEKEFEYY